MPEKVDDYIRAGQEWLSRLDIDADQLALLRKSMTDVRVGVIVDVVGMGEISAYGFAKAEAGRLWAWTELADARFEAGEPEQVEEGVIRVGVLVGVTELNPADAVRSACAVFADRKWSEPDARTIADHQFSYWVAGARPDRGARCAGTVADHRARTSGAARRPRLRLSSRRLTYALNPCGRVSRRSVAQFTELSQACGS
jgi:hypothetical protein